MNDDFQLDSLKYTKVIGVIEKNDTYFKGTYALLNNIIKKKLLERANLGHGSL